MTSNIRGFLIEDSYNSCYINSLLMALFYIPSRIDNLLNSDPKQSIHCYLQQIIKNKFIDVAKKNQTIISETVNEIRNYSHLCGWNDINKLLENHDVIQYFTFLMDCFNGIPIQVLNNSDKSFFIKYNVPESHNELTIKNIVNNWNNDNIILNTPIILGIHLNRFDNEIKKTTKINIQKKIKLADNLLNNYNEWLFHSIICHSGDSLKNGHYYTIISNCNKWFIFDDKNWPCVKEIRMDDPMIVDKIKQECVFVIYKYQDKY